VFGTVYRPAAFTVQPSGVSVHVGDPGTGTLVVTNTDPNDGYSENLIATVIGTTGGVQAHGSTGDIAPQSTGSIGLSFPTAMAGLIGTVTLDLKSDGTGIDGLGQIDLGDVTVPVFVTSTNVSAAAQIEKVSGPGTFTQHGSVYTLDLGTIDTAPGSINLGVLNSAIAPADTLGGSFSISGDPAFTNTGFGAFTGIASASADTAPTVNFAPTAAGTYTETITLVPVDETGAGNAPLSNETLTIRPPASATEAPFSIEKTPATLVSPVSALLCVVSDASATNELVPLSTSAPEPAMLVISPLAYSSSELPASEMLVASTLGAAPAVMSRVALPPRLPFR
jgi:hypothetical protein